MFQDCASLQRVGSVDVRAASNIECMFKNCGGLLGVCSVRARRDVRHFGMFADTELGRRVYGENGDAFLARMALGIGA